MKQTFVSDDKRTTIDELCLIKWYFERRKKVFESAKLSVGKWTWRRLRHPTDAAARRKNGGRTRDRTSRCFVRMKLAALAVIFKATKSTTDRDKTKHRAYFHSKGLIFHRVVNKRDRAFTGALSAATSL